jgi:hypothetical protein
LATGVFRQLYTVSVTPNERELFREELKHVYYITINMLYGHFGKNNGPFRPILLCLFKLLLNIKRKDMKMINDT